MRASRGAGHPLQSAQSRLKCQVLARLCVKVGETWINILLTLLGNGAKCDLPIGCSFDPCYADWNYQTTITKWRTE